MGLEIKIQVPAGQAVGAREFLLEHERERANRPPSDDDDCDNRTTGHNQRQQNRSDVFELPDEDRRQCADGDHRQRYQSPELGLNAVRHV